MAWRFFITKEAENDLDNLDKQIQKRVLEKLAWLATNFDEVVPLPLGGKWRGFFKLRMGDWRIIYEADGKKEEIFIHHIGRRDEVYKYKK